MADLIAKANPDRVGVDGSITSGPLQVPPIPMRAFSEYRFNDVEARTFDPEKMTYDLKTATGATKTIDVSRPPPVLGNSELRRGRYTELVVTMTDDVRAAVSGTNAAIRALIALDDDPDHPGMAELQLLGAQDPACDSASAWLPSSPYRASIKFSDDDVEKLERQAELKPLTLIDFNFLDGHGAKVRAVVSETLGRLGLERLNRDAFIKTVDLNPASNRAGLGSMLAKYKEFLLGLVGHEQAAVFAPAEHWIDSFTPPDDKAEKQEVPSLVLQAVLRHTQPAADTELFLHDKFGGPLRSRLQLHGQCEGIRRLCGRQQRPSGRHQPQAASGSAALPGGGQCDARPVERKDRWGFHQRHQQSRRQFDCPWLRLQHDADQGRR